MSKLATECAFPNTPAPHRTFTIDSYNIHRLLIAGVTVASKFFSDVFYTNSRYAKVGGLPQTELNQLELHFLLLNDFRSVRISSPHIPHLTSPITIFIRYRLSIPIDEMQRYAEQLLRYSAGMSPEEAFSPSATAPPHVPAPAPSSPLSYTTTTFPSVRARPEPELRPQPQPHRPAHLQLRTYTPTSAIVGGTSPGHLSTSFSTSSYPKTSHHDVEGRAWNAANNAQRRVSTTTPTHGTYPIPTSGTNPNASSDAASIYSVDASESGYGSTTDSDTIRAHWSSSESAMTEDGEDATDDGASTGTVEDRDQPSEPERGKATP